jgi:hypothetical protein
LHPSRRLGARVLPRFGSGKNSPAMCRGSFEWCMPRSNVVTRRRLHNRKVLALLFGLFFVLTASSAFASVITSYSNTVALQNGLVGWWTFDGKNTHWDTGKTDDSSGNGNSGSLISMSTTTSPVRGKMGQALKFNGTNQYVNVPYSSTFAPTNITVSFWMKTSQAINTAFLTALSRGYDGSVTPWGFDFRNDLPGSNACSGVSCYLIFGTFPGGTEHGCLGTKDFNLDTTNIGKWYLVTGTFDGSTYRLYFNGVQNCSSSDSTALATNTKGLNIAYLDVNGSPGRFFPGTIDDVRIYNRALSAQEIYQLWAIGK